MSGKRVYVHLLKMHVCVCTENGETLTQHTNVQCCLVGAVVGDGPSPLDKQKETSSTTEVRGYHQYNVAIMSLQRRNCCGCYAQN